MSMSDYTELVNRLRKRGERINKFGSPFFTEANANDMISAADAIEKLALNLGKASNSGGMASKEETE